MANPLLPSEKHNLARGQIEALGKQSDLGHAFLVIAAQCAVVAVVLLLWAGKDLTYSPGWAHPIIYYFGIAAVPIVCFGVAGFFLRRGTSRID